MEFTCTQAVSWRAQEPGPLLHKYERYEFWLSVLKETIELATQDACSKDLEVKILKTNIRKLAEIEDKELYVKSWRGMCVASEIQDLLSPESRATGKMNSECQTPWELRCLLLELNEQDIVPWLSLLNEDTNK